MHNMSSAPLCRPPEVETADQEHTIVHQNTALSYACFKVANFLMPYYAEFWNDTMKNLELHVDSNNVDPADPIGVGNLAGKRIAVVTVAGSACVARALWRIYICYQPASTALTFLVTLHNLIAPRLRLMFQAYFHSSGGDKLPQSRWL